MKLSEALSSELLKLYTCAGKYLPLPQACEVEYIPRAHEGVKDGIAWRDGERWYVSFRSDKPSISALLKVALLMAGGESALFLTGILLFAIQNSLPPFPLLNLTKLSLATINNTLKRLNIETVEEYFILKSTIPRIMEPEITIDGLKFTISPKATEKEIIEAFLTELSTALTHPIHTLEQKILKELIKEVNP